MSKIYTFLYIPFFLILGFSFLNETKAQAWLSYGKDEYVFKNNSLSLSLYPLVYNGLNIEYDRRIRQKHWLRLSPTFYSANNYATLRKTDIRRMGGADIALYHLYSYFSIPQSGFKLYLQYGLLYGFNHIVDVSDTRADISKYGADIALGMRKNLGNTFYFDIMLGYGYRHSIVSMELERKNIQTFDENMYDYGYTGPIFRFGIAIGLMF